MDAGHGGLYRPILLGGDYLLDREFNRQHRPLSITELGVTWGQCACWEQP